MEERKDYADIIEPLKHPAPPEGEIVQVKNGPFKGRTYRRNALGQLELIATPKRPLHRRRSS